MTTPAAKAQDLAAPGGMGKRPKVLILVENLPVPFDRRVWLEATALRDAGYGVSVICPKGDTSYRESYVRLEGISIYRYQLPPTATGFKAYFREYGVAMLMTLWLSLHALVRDGFDVIHACNPPDLFFAIAWFYKPLGKRFVFDQHDLSPETFQVQFHGKFRPVFLLLRFLEWLTYQTSNAVISTNESVKEIAHRRGGVPLEKLFVVRTGPDFSRLRLVPPDAALKRGRQYLVAYLGVMGPQDGVDLALRAAHELVVAQGRRDVQFTFIGKGDHTPALKQLAHELGLDEYVEFTGRVSDDDLVRYLSTADVCLSPDPANGLNEFHTMNKTMEYMAMGRPVVAFDIRETRYSAQGAALYAQPNDVREFAARVEELLASPDLRSRLGATGRERVRRALGWDHTHVALLECYRYVFRDWAPALAVARRAGVFNHLQLGIKRLVDVVGAGTALVALSPLLGAIALGIKLTSRGPILYRWQVVGEGGRPFTGYKFRTMVVNADALKAQLMAQNEMSGPVFKIRRDPRITSIGRFLRRYSLDELPQLWSVLKGDMSLVGPRPPLRTEFAQFTEWQKQKLAVKPGITCLWQISGRNDIADFDQWVKLDLDYIEHWSLALDLKILLGTLPAVIRARGAS